MVTGREDYVREAEKVSIQTDQYRYRSVHE
jgi:hypothetical protein